jgi:tetratricopeptide (TPR) repeat protein
MTKRAKSKSSISVHFWSLAAIVVVVALAFLPSLQNGFLDWDDQPNVVANPNLKEINSQSLKWMFTTFLSGHYHPLTWLSLAIDYRTWRLDPLGYHLGNLVLHGLNAVLFYLLFVTLIRVRSSQDTIPRIWPPALVATLFFAIHPLRVESVAWITERRDVLSAFFLLVSILAYLRFASDNETRWRWNRWYWLALAAFFFSLLSKAWGITLPIVLLVLDVYPLGRLRLARASANGGSITSALLVEKVPFVVLSAAFTMTAFFAQRGSAMHLVRDHGPLDRAMQAAYGLCFYPLKTIWPVSLSPLYLLKNAFDPFTPENIACLVVFVAVTSLLIAKRKAWPWALAAWVSYVVIVSPVLGLAQSGQQIVADRYTYLSCIPFAILVGLGAMAYQRRRERLNASTFVKALSLVLVLGGVTALGALTYRQCRVWNSDRTLWEHAIKLDGGNYVALYNRGVVRMNEGDSKGALEDFDAAIALEPLYHDAYVNRGNTLSRVQRPEAAMNDYAKALDIDPDDESVLFNRGLVLVGMGRFEEAIDDLLRALESDSNNATMMVELGAAYQLTGDRERALSYFDRAIEKDEANPYYLFRRGFLYHEMGKPELAISDLDRALTLEPNNPNSRFNRAVVRAETGDLVGAVGDLRIILRSTTDPEERRQLERHIDNLLSAMKP